MVACGSCDKVDLYGTEGDPCNCGHGTMYSISGGIEGDQNLQDRIDKERSRLDREARGLNPKG